MISLKEPGYEHLKKLLEEKRWRDADQATYQLMSHILGKREEEINCRGIKEFPCNDLQKIDQLWVEHSHGKFGFSVQQRIWEEVCETTNDLSWSGYESRRGTFCELVGWAKTYAEENDPFKRFVHYDDLCLSRTGQLPNGRAASFFATRNYYLAWSAEYWWGTDATVKHYGFDFDRLMEQVAVCIPFSPSEADLHKSLIDMSDLDAMVRGRAAHMLGKIRSNVAIPILLKALDDSDYQVRNNAVNALGKIGSDAVIPELLKRMDILDGNGCWIINNCIIIRALGKIGSDAAIPALLKGLIHSDALMRETAIQALREIGSDAAIHELERLSLA